MDQVFCDMAEEAMDHVADNNVTCEADDSLARKKPRYTRLGFQIKDDDAPSHVTGNYWAGSGKYQSLYDRILDEHMPESGEPTTGGTDALICYAISKVLHEYYNNGFGNAIGDFKGITVESAKTDTFSFDWPEMVGFLVPYSTAARQVIEHYANVANQHEDDDDDDDEEDEEEEGEEDDEEEGEEDDSDDESYEEDSEESSGEESDDAYSEESK